jgi:hypothetical protein
MASAKSLDEQLSEALAAHATAKIELTTDENNNIIIDKDQYPELFDWAVS